MSRPRCMLLDRGCSGKALWQWAILMLRHPQVLCLKFGLLASHSGQQGRPPLAQLQREWTMAVSRGSPQARESTV